MTQKILKVVMYKSIAHPEKNIEYTLSKEIDNFVYQTGGCITGWSRHIDTPPETQDTISYTCSIEDQSDHRSDLRDFLDTIQAKHDIQIIGDINTSETIKIHFED